MISVVIPTFNRQQTLERSVRSVLDQTYRDLELWVVDDGSTDGTEALVASIEDPRLHYYRVPRQGGACRARNQGVTLARGEWVAFQDSDDAWHPEKLAVQMAMLEKTGADACFCAMDRHGYGNRAQQMSPRLKAGLVPRAHLVRDSVVSTQTLVARRDLLLERPFDPEMPRLQDFEWVLAVSDRASFAFCPEPLVDVYLQNDSITASGNAKMADAYRRIFSAHAELQELFPRESAYLLRVSSMRFGKEEAVAMLARAQELAPTWHTALLKRLVERDARPSPVLSALYYWK